MSTWERIKNNMHCRLLTYVKIITMWLELTDWLSFISSQINAAQSASQTISLGQQYHIVSFSLQFELTQPIPHLPELYIGCKLLNVRIQWQNLKYVHRMKTFSSECWTKTLYGGMTMVWKLWFQLYSISVFWDIRTHCRIWLGEMPTMVKCRAKKCSSGNKYKMMIVR